MANAGIVIPDPPPPRAVVYAVLAFILNLLAVGALFLDQYTLGTWLAVGALVFSGLTVYALLRPGTGGRTGVQGTATTDTTQSGTTGGSTPTGGSAPSGQ